MPQCPIAGDATANRQGYPITMLEFKEHRQAD
jgi:hypothetical protein